MTKVELEELIHKAEEDIRHGDFANAENLARQIKHLHEKNASGNETILIRALLTLSISLWKRGLAKDALPCSEQAFALSTEMTGLGKKELKAKSLNDLGNVYARLFDHTKAIEYYEAALLLFKELDSKEGMAVCSGDLGNLYIILPNYSKALESYEKAFALSEEIGDTYGAANNTGNIGSVYYYHSEYAKALEYFEKALALSLECRDKQNVAIFTANIGNVFNDLSDYSMSLKYFKEALARCEEIDDTEGVAHELRSIGDTYAKLKDYPQALTYLKKALSIYENLGDKRGIGYACAKLGHALREMGRKEEAMQYFQEDLRHRREILKTNERVADSLISIGSMLAEDNHFDEAIEKLEEALALSEQLGEKRASFNAHKVLASIYAKQGETSKELDHIKKQYVLKEEIYGEETRNRVEVFNFRIAISEKEKERKIESMKREQLEIDLANSAIHIASHTELLDKFRIDMQQIVRQIDEPINALKKIKEKLKELPCRQIDWTKFEVQFSQVHPDFRKKLAEKYSDLTEMEQRIAAMVRMDLKSSDIARLFCITERAVEFHRLNLRKKLHLKPQENLKDFLQGIS